MRPTTPQPEWLKAMIYGYAGFKKWRVLDEGRDFAIVQAPGGTWGDIGGQHYGKTTYYLVAKRGDPRNGHGIRDWKELQHGGRAKLADWKALVVQSDALGVYADEVTKGWMLESIVDALDVYLSTRLTEAQYRSQGGMAAMGKSKDYWAGQIEAYKQFREKLKTLAPGLLPEDNSKP